MAPEAKVAVFDLDGTLTDSAPGIVASYRYALDAWGIEVDDRAIRRWIGPPLHDGFLALGVPSAEVDQAISRYREFFSTQGVLQNAIYPGIAAMLATLSEAGVTVALATSKLEESALKVLDQFSLLVYFQVVVGASRDGTRTHKSEILEHALNRLGDPDPSTVVMIGDREHDVRAAVDLGVRPVGVTWGYGTTTELLEAGAAALVESPPQLTSLLLGKGGTASSGPG